MAYREEGTITLKMIAQDLMSGNVGKAIGNLDKLAQKGGLVGSVAQGVGQSFGQMLNPMRLATQGIGMLTDFLGSAVSAGMAEEASIAALTKSLEENSKGWDGNIAAVEDVIEARQKLAFSDDEQRDSLRMLVGVTGDVNKALDIQRQAMDLARLRGMNLADASTVLGKVYAGNIGILRRYGINIGDIKDKTKALARIQEMTAGQAETFADTTAGAMLSMQIALDNVVEDIGLELLPIMKDLAIFARDEVVPAIQAIVDAIKGAGPVIAALAPLLTGNMADAAKAAADLAAQGGTDLVTNWLNAITAKEPEVKESVATAITRPIDDAVDASVRKVARMPGRLSTALKAGKDEVRTAMAELKWAMEHPLARSEHIAWLKGKLTSKRLAKGLRSNKPDIRNAARDTLDALQDGLTASGAVSLGWTIRNTTSLRKPKFRGGTGSGGGIGDGGAEGGRAHGGPVHAGGTYLVGERGPELLKMGNQSGNVVPNGRMGGDVHIHIHAAAFMGSPIEAQRFAQLLVPDLQRALARAG